MKIKFFSDTHFEHHLDDGKCFMNLLDSREIDVLIIAGDLSTIPMYDTILPEISRLYPKTFIIFGNHEFYVKKPIHQLMDVANKIANNCGNITILENSYEDYNGLRFAGTTMWFSPSPMDFFYRDEFNDFNCIKGFRRFVYSANQRAKEFIQSTPTDIMITHHLPSYLCVDKQYKGDPLNPFFVTEMFDYIYDSDIKYWIFGHTHNSVALNVNGTKLACNPFGYPHAPNPIYYEKFVIDTDTWELRCL